MEGLSTQSLLKTKNIGQLSFADEEGEEIQILPKKKKQVPKEEKKEKVEEVVVPKQPKPKINLLEEDEETKRQKQEAIEVSCCLL